MEKVFLVFNTAAIGDMLVTNTLVRNIKYYYPQSKVVFICNTPFVDVAKYQDGVDDVVIFDKKKDKTLKGIFNFVKNFPYKKPFASFVTYSNERNILISRLLGSKHVLSNHKGIYGLLNTREKFKIPEYIHMKDCWAGMIEALVGEYQNLPIKYNPPEVNTPVVQKVKSLKRPVIISTTSNYYKKDMEVNDCVELFKLMNNEGLTPVYTGAGAVSADFAEKLEGCEFVNLVNQTSFVELANIMKICGSCITVDTGTLHFANALGIPVVSIFYDGHTDMWAPDERLYRAKTLDGYHSPKEIMDAYNELCGARV